MSGARSCKFLKVKLRTLDFKTQQAGNSLAVQWLGLCAFTANGVGSVPAQGTMIPQAALHGQKKKKIATGSH